MIRAVRARQRQLLIPESFEWIDEAAPEMTAAAPGAGLAVRAWTVDDPARVAQLVALAVDAVVTDDVSMAVAVARLPASS